MFAYLIDPVSWILVGCAGIYMFPYLYILVAWIIIGYSVVHSVNPRKPKMQIERYECPAQLHYAPRMGAKERKHSNANMRRSNQSKPRSHQSIYRR